jgi:thiosulfate/3-mercaptopyruvate sulfurtransferase
MPNDPRNAKQEHFAERITLDTQFFDHEEIVMPNSNLPHTLPPLDVFQAHLTKMYIDAHDYIVCYDNVGIFSAPRAAWMLRYFGANNVRVLNGGMKKWKAEGRTTVSGPQKLP